MAVFNQFRFIGTVFGDCRYSTSQSGMPYVRFALVVNTNESKKENHYIPIYSTGKIADKIVALCSNGSRVAVCGEVITNEQVSMHTGRMAIEIGFFATDIMRIYKPSRRKIETTEFTELIKNSVIDDYISPQPKILTKKGK